MARISAPRRVPGSPRRLARGPYSSSRFNPVAIRFSPRWLFHCPTSTRWGQPPREHIDSRRNVRSCASRSGRGLPGNTVDPVDHEISAGTTSMKTHTLKTFSAAALLGLATLLHYPQPELGGDRADAHRRRANRTRAGFDQGTADLPPRLHPHLRTRTAVPGSEKPLAAKSWAEHRVLGGQQVLGDAENGSERPRYRTIYDPQEYMARHPPTGALSSAARPGTCQRPVCGSFRCPDRKVSEPYRPAARNRSRSVWVAEISLSKAVAKAPIIDATPAGTAPPGHSRTAQVPRPCSRRH